VETRLKLQTDLNVISRERSGLFGLAILWIMLYHSTLPVKWEFMASMKDLGYGGVDVFLFLSGIGLFYSMEREPSIPRFYRKRAVRVLLPFFLVAVVYEGERWLRGTINGVQFLENVTLVSYWTRGYAVFWFVAAIVMFYIIYPPVYRAVKSRRPGLYLTLLVGLAAGLIFWMYYMDKAMYHRICGTVYRMPVFFLGCFTAPYVREGRPVRLVPAVLVCAVTAVVSFNLCVTYNNMFCQPYLLIPLSISSCMLCSIGLSFLGKRNVIRRVLEFLGGITFEIYLVHEKLLVWANTNFPNHVNTWEINGLAFLLAVGSAWLLGKICGRIGNRLLRPSR